MPKMPMANQTRDQSPIDQSIEKLGKMVEHLTAELAELTSRLGPVSCPVPEAQEKHGDGRLIGCICYVESRIEGIAERVSALAAGVRATRDGLRI